MVPTNAVPPHSLEAERSVLGAVLLSPQRLAAVYFEERLTPEDFHHEPHGWAFAAMIELEEEKRPIDVLSVAQRLNESGHPGLEGMLDDATGWVPAAGHVGEYAKIVRRHALRRRLLTTTYEVQAGVAADEPLHALIESAERNLLNIADAGAGELAGLTGDDEVERLLLVRDGVEVVGVGSGFVDLDRITSGFQAGNLIVLAARPSMGKSALVVNIAEHVAAKGLPVALFSFEMSRGEILRRLLASRARVSGSELLRGPIRPDRWDKVLQAVKEVTEWPLFVDDSSNAGVIDIRAKARRVNRHHPLGLVIVDYVQLMRAEGSENRNIEVGNITRGLKLLARELNVAVIAVSQLSRQVEQRADKHPMLSDLRDSGSIEQDADLVAFLYRDGYYNSDTEDPDVSELHVAKHRNGPTGTVKLTWLERYPLFANYMPAERWDDALPPAEEPMPF